MLELLDVRGCGPTFQASGQTFEIERGGASDRERRHLGLEDQPAFDDAGGAERTGARQEGVIRRWTAAGLEGAAPDVADDELLLLQHLQRTPHGIARHAVGFAEFALRRQLVAHPPAR